MALTRVAIPTTTYSSRHGTTVTTIVCHTAEGATNFRDLGAFFQNSANTSNPTSSHVGIDDTPGTVGEYVPRTGCAWTAASANGFSVQAELCGFAKWTPAEWQSHPNMLSNLAAWIAEEAAYFGIPIVALSPAQAQDPNARGVCQHIDLQGMGGGHVDCDYGTGNFPFAQVLEMAAGGSAAPGPASWEEPDMVIIRISSGAAATFDGVKKMGIPDPDSMKALQDAGVKLANVSNDFWNRIPNG